MMAPIDFDPRTQQADCHSASITTRDMKRWNESIDRQAYLRVCKFVANAYFWTPLLSLLPASTEKTVASILFCYDKHAGQAAGQICEAAYLASKDINVVRFAV